LSVVDAPAMVRLTAEQLEAIRLRAEASLYYFAKAILGYEYLNEEFHRPVCDFVQSPALRKLVVLARGHFKSTIAAISYPIWRAVQDPSIRILLASSTATNAEKFLSAIKNHFESNGLLRALWPHVLPDTSKVRWNNVEAELRRPKVWTEATFEAIGVGGKVASRHYDLIIEDDLVDLSDEEDLTDVAEKVAAAVNWHQYSRSLFVNAESGENLVIGTKWGRDDLIAWVENNEMASRIGDSPRAFQRYWVPALRGGKPTFRKSEDGRHGFTLAGLTELRAILGAYKFSGQYLLDPSDPSVAEFQRSWLRYYDLGEDGRLVPTGVVDKEGRSTAYGVGQLNRYVLVDPALSRKRKSDYTGLVVVGAGPAPLKFVLEATAIKAEPLELIEALIAANRRWAPIAVGIEVVAFQKLLGPFLQFVARTRGIYIPVREFRTDTQVSKENRIRSLVPEFARGHVFLGRGMLELEQEIEGFPTARDQHLLDALAYGTQLWIESESEEEVAAEAEEDEVALSARNPLTGYSL